MSAGTEPGQASPNRPRILAESSRVEAFSDGVLAIAITLLVLDLHTGERGGSVGRDLLTQWPTYLAYLAYLALLLAASVLPFPTAELAFAMGPHGTAGDRDSALLLYAVISAAMAVTWLIMFSYLHRHPHLLRAGVPAAFFRTERLRAIAGIIAPFIPVLVGRSYPLAALGLMVVMPVFYAATAEGLRGHQPAPG